MNPLSKKGQKRAERKRQGAIAKKYPVAVQVLRQLCSANIESRFIQPFEPTCVEPDGTIFLKLGPLTFPDRVDEIVRLKILEETP